MYKYVQLCTYFKEYWVLDYSWLRIFFDTTTKKKTRVKYKKTVFVVSKNILNYQQLCTHKWDNYFNS